MNRRVWLQNSALAIAGFGFQGCAANRVARVLTPNTTSRRPMLKLAPVEASWDRVIRTTVGLRPHRDAGFVLKAGKLDEKTVIHNYGHGGSGMSLSWGTGQMASELALEVNLRERRAAVIGCGVVGLTSARQLQRRGFDVTIYAMSVPPDTTSNMSLAGFTPTSGLVDNNRRTPEWDAQFRRAATIAYNQLEILVGPNYGVSWVDSYNLVDSVPDPPAANSLLPAALRTGSEVLREGEHPFPTKYAVRNPTIRIEPNIYLDALIRDFTMFGGRIVIRKFDTPRDLMSVSEQLIVNCTGLGAGALFGDDELIPLKGQLTHFVPQPEVNYFTNGGAPPPSVSGGLSIHMMPRRDGIALGGTSERGVWTLEPNEEARKQIVDAHIQVFSAMRAHGAS